jgi:AcrR family transcriptional regulator
MLAAEEKSDPRVRRTKQLLQQAFVDLARIKSFEDLTVKDITDRATVNRATFYAHFDDKYALLDETIRTTFLQIVQRRLPTGAVTSSNDLEQVVLAVCDFLRQFDGNCWQVQRRFGVLIEREIKALVADLLQAWFVKAGAQQLPDGATAQLAATMASWAIYGAALHWSHQHPRQPEDDFARSVLLLVAGNVTLVQI